jgi:hypothetical protein
VADDSAKQLNRMKAHAALTQNKRKITEKSYKPFGGFNSMLKQYVRCELTFKSIGNAIGVSYESVRQDLIRRLGKTRYIKLKQGRRLYILNKQKEKQGALREQTCNVRKAIKILNSRKSTVSEKKAEEFDLLIKLFSIINKHGIGLIVKISPRGPLKYALTNGRTLRIRVASADDKYAESKVGMHRFDVRPTVTLDDFAIYTIFDPDSGRIHSYIFNTCEVKHLRSLNLRFKWFNRQSKYDYAKERWALLKNA